MSSNYKSAAMNLSQLLATDDHRWGNAVLYEQKSDWHGALLSEIVGVIGNDDIEYLSSTFDVLPQDEASAKIAVFTESVFVLTTVKVKRSERAEVKTLVVGRSSLRSLIPSNRANVLDPFGVTRWPEEYKVTLDYAATENIQLPLNQSDERRAQALLDFVPWLTKDLS